MTPLCIETQEILKAIIQDAVVLDKGSDLVHISMCIQDWAFLNATFKDYPEGFEDE